MASRATSCRNFATTTRPVCSVNPEVTRFLRTDQSDLGLSTQGRVLWHGIDLDQVAETFGTPLKLTYVPAISQNSRSCKNMFESAMAKHKYKGRHKPCYCTKTNHYKFVVEETIRAGMGLEFSSPGDLRLLRSLHASGLVKVGDSFDSMPLLCNGHKTSAYISEIVAAHASGFRNIMPVLDSAEELGHYLANPALSLPSPGSPNGEPLHVGLRLQMPSSRGLPCRFGVSRKQAVQLCTNEIAPLAGVVELRMLHAFATEGIADAPRFWEELERTVDVFLELKALVPSLNSINLGGGMPHTNSFALSSAHAGPESCEMDTAHPVALSATVDRLVEYIGKRCRDAGVEEPDLFTEFGTHTAANAAVSVFGITSEKLQDSPQPSWYLIDGSFIGSLPDTWAQKQRFDFLPLNHLNREFHSVVLGGLTCDSDDVYGPEQHGRDVRLPKLSPHSRLAHHSSDGAEDLKVAFFNTGAYQDNLSGVGGLQHCLLDTPRHFVARVIEEIPATAVCVTNEPKDFSTVVVAAVESECGHTIHVPLVGTQLEQSKETQAARRVVEIREFHRSNFETTSELLGYTPMREAKGSRYPSDSPTEILLHPGQDLPQNLQPQELVSALDVSEVENSMSPKRSTRSWRQRSAVFYSTTANP